MNIDKNIVIDANSSALNFHISTVARVQQLCDPLKYLGITAFGYLKIFDDSRYLHIGNHDKWSRYFIQNVHDTGKFFSHLFSLAHSEVVSFVWPDETTDDLLLNLKKHNIFHGISFFKRANDFTETWNFGTQLGNTGIYELYLKHSDLLWKFAQYFGECAEDLIDHSDPRKLGIYKNGPIFPSKNLLGEGVIEKFLQGIETRKYLMKYNQNWAFISEKEKQSLELASKGLKQSNQIGLSPYIVNKHLGEVKLRLGAICMNELLNAFKSSFDAKMYLEDTTQT